MSLQQFNLPLMLSDSKKKGALKTNLHIRAVICFFCLIVTLGIASCAARRTTLYHQGAEDVQLNPDTFRVSFGREGVHPEDARNLALLHSAEVALDHGFDYFVILNTSADASPDETQRVLAQQTATADHTQTPLATGFASGIASIMGDSRVRLSVTHLIKGFKEKPPASGDLVYDARFLVTSLKKAYGIDEYDSQH